MKPSMEELRKIQHKPNVKEDLYLRIHRKVSIYLSWILLHTNISANQTSFLSILVGIAATYFFLFPSPAYWIIGYLVLQLHLLLDVCDGEIARYRGQTSEFGIYMDDLNHAIVNPFIFISMSFGFYNIFNDPLVFIIGVSAVFGILLLRVHNTTFINLRGLDSLKKGRKRDVQQKTVRKVYRIYSFFFREFGGLMHLLLVSVILDIILEFLNFSLILGNVAINFRFLYFILGGVFFPLVFIQRLFKFRNTQK